MFISEEFVIKQSPLTLSLNLLLFSQNFELLAVYFKKDLDDYRPPDSWKFLESDKDIIGR